MRIKTDEKVVLVLKKEHLNKQREKSVKKYFGKPVHRCPQNVISKVLAGKGVPTFIISNMTIVLASIELRCDDEIDK